MRHRNAGEAALIALCFHVANVKISQAIDPAQKINEMAAMIISDVSPNSCSYSRSSHFGKGKTEREE